MTVYAVQHPEAWAVWDPLTAYRFVHVEAPYSPAQAWPSSSGRFDNGVRHTLYMASTASAAVAEYYRRHPELIGFQDSVRLRTFQMTLVSETEGLDVRRPEQGIAVGIAWDRLRSSEKNEHTRYHECRELADDVEAAGGMGIAHSSAAYEGSNTFVSFGEAAPEGWHITAVTEIDTPRVDPGRVRLIER